MPGFTSLCVYCGSRTGDRAAFRSAADALGREMGARGMRLVYGGGRGGMMGVIAEAVRAEGGQVTGVVPRHLLAVEAGTGAADDLEIVDSMHERKARMADLADGFVILPGGLGTLDEFFEILTWKQLGLHDRPIIVIDVEGYWQPLAHLISHLVASGFARPMDARMLRIVDSVEGVFEELAVLTPSERKIAADKL